jgi:hypothetical protein
MSKQANGLQRMAGVSDGTMGGYAEGFAATEFSGAAMLAASRGAVTRARDRELAALTF